MVNRFGSLDVVPELVLEFDSKDVLLGGLEEVADEEVEG